ncbi:hypothetical protein [Natrononativus amylolyticus]|uniref:hypothetical protein n=1 Tax=Natrononativus amylolyticus TaxID=2963434 RepID=UPI0020CC0657|nr:hypothetical protein [Natrononativus amylolyticus]
MVPPETSPFVVAPDIGTAYTALLESRVHGLFPHDYHVVHISEPVSSIDYDEFSIERSQWLEVVNTGETLGRFESYEFTDGTTGRYWVQDRIEELFAGLYATRLTAPRNQLDMIRGRLKQGNHGQTTNALLGQPYRLTPDLEKATEGKPLAPNIPCLVLLQFKPQRDKLHLYTTFRSQYIDTKCYGNLISLALLLADMCHQTGYEPGYLVETAHNSIFRNVGDARGLSSVLSDDPPKGTHSIS